MLPLQEGAVVEERLADEELVLRLCYRSETIGALGIEYPGHTDPATGLLRVESVQIQDLQARGFSVERKHLFTVELGAQAEKVKKERHVAKTGVDDVVLEGAVSSAVSSIHGIKDNAGVGIFKVLPDPLDGHPGHAVVLAVGKHGRSALMKYRIELANSFGKVLSLQALLADVPNAACG